MRPMRTVRGQPRAVSVVTATCSDRSRETLVFSVGPINHPPATGERASIVRVIQRYKGILLLPMRREALKYVVREQVLGGVPNKL